MITLICNVELRASEFKVHEHCRLEYAKVCPVKTKHRNADSVISDANFSMILDTECNTDTNTEIRTETFCASNPVVPSSTVPPYNYATCAALREAKPGTIINSSSLQNPPSIINLIFQMRILWKLMQIMIE